MSSSVRNISVREFSAATSPSWLLAGLLLIGFAVRLLFVNGEGFHNDIAAFESWTLTLSQHPPTEFYSSSRFTDYPPGYFFVLWVVGLLYRIFVHADPTYSALRVAIKIPAILMDLADAALIYAIVRRFSSVTWALGAAAFFVLNPAAIYVSSFWGQIDSISAGLILGGIYALLRADDGEQHEARWIVVAWLAMAASIFIKPQGLIVGVLFAAYPFAARDAVIRMRRLRATATGIGASLVLAILASEAFHPSANPIAVLEWLYGRYAFGSAVYPYTTINAFNVYAIFREFWQPDTTPLVLALPMLPAISIPFLSPLAFGIALVAGATVLVTVRYLQVGTERALVEGAVLLALAFFCLLTRMHERYIYNAFVLSIVLLAFGRRYLYIAAALTLTLFANLAYSLAYQTAVESKVAGANPYDLWPLVSHPLSALNVAIFFALGYTYFGGSVGALDAVEARVWSVARNWYAPLEGVARMTRRDIVLAAVFAVASLVLCLLWYQFPAEKVFDEVYYARAGEEYLKHIEIFEYTHPPLTKLIVTVSMLLFGGLSAAGDSGFGWRFLNIVLGALTVAVIYAFGKRLTGSTLFASLAAGMLLFDGFHYVQSRIATPEIGVSFFSLLVLYAFYRYWIASQVRQRAVPLMTQPAVWIPYAVVMAGGAIAAVVLAQIAVRIGPNTTGAEFVNWTFAVVFAYVLGVAYLVARLIIPRRTPFVAQETSYAEGSRLIAGISNEPAVLRAPDGQTVRPASGRTGAEREDADGDLRIAYGRDGSVEYATPEGRATYRSDGTFEAGSERGRARDAWVWFGVLTVCGGLLGASKWNGLFDFFVVWLLVAIVALQRFRRAPALYGNPYGVPLDVLIVGMGVVGGAIYALCYIPYFLLGHNLVDVVSLQHQMYWYHSTLKATHPYQSQWWQWPLILRPIAYYYHDFRTFAQTAHGSHCCVAEILALPNPLVWWLGLISVPFAAFLAWRERNKGCMLLVVAYVLQWLPWIGSPRIAFEYHFYPNLSIIVLANAVLLQRLWQLRWATGGFRVARFVVAGYALSIVISFAFFYPVLAGMHVTYDEWHLRMWLSSWI